MACESSDPAGGSSIHCATTTETTTVSSSTIYVGNLDVRVNKEMLRLVFEQVGTIRRIKFVNEYGVEPYAFIEYTDHGAADFAVMIMNNRVLFEKPMRVNWAIDAGGIKKDTRGDYHIFIGDLEFNVDIDNLREAFIYFGEITDIRIVRDSVSGKSKGYGFVSFRNRMDAVAAIKEMNGKPINGRPIKVDWATKRGTNQGISKVSYNEVALQTSWCNSTVYVGGLPHDMTELKLWPYFSKFGPITNIKLFSERCYAFISYSSHEPATTAICEMNGACVDRRTIKCSWGKEAHRQSQYHQYCYMAANPVSSHHQL